MTLITGTFVGVMAIFVAVGLWAGRRREDPSAYAYGSQDLPAWQVGISGAATANSGFIMLGAVGIGYQLGATGVLIPLCWFLGDLVFWRLFPHRFREATSVEDGRVPSLPRLLTGSEGSSGRWFRVVVALLLIAVVGTYGASQMLAGGKTIQALFGFTTASGATLTALIVALYTVWGGFRASVWTDLLQGALMILVTAGALLSVAWQLVVSGVSGTVETAFFLPFSGMSVVMAVGFASGWAAAALGFGLSQPQVVARFTAGASVDEVRRAKWIYLSFLQFTWTGMTLFGMLARLRLPGLEDPEVALLSFALASYPEIATGLVLAAVFAAVASTVDSVVVAITGLIADDTLPLGLGVVSRPVRVMLAGVTLAALVGLAVASSLNVFQLSLLPVELIAASVGPIAALRLIGRAPHAGKMASLIFLGVVGVIGWRWIGWESAMSAAFVAVPVFTIGAVLLPRARVEARRPSVPA